MHLKNVAYEAVENTPNQLPKLKEAGVVDAGGKGIFYVLEGFEKSVTDPEMLKDLERIVQSRAKRKERLENTTQVLEDIKFKYCTEFIIESGDFDLNEYKAKISPLGDSLVCAQTAKKTKTHIHTNHPGQVLEIAGTLGNLNNIKIENMEIQHQNLLISENANYQVESTEKIFIRSENATPIAYYAIVDNKELGSLFLDDGATAVLIGGQTQNPSVADIEEGLKRINAEEIVILPNNKNIISAAKMAAERSNKKIMVLEDASDAMSKDEKDEKIEDILKQTARNSSIEITKAVRNTKVDDIQIEEGNYIALVNGKIKIKSENLVSLIKEIYEMYINENTLNIFAVTGEGATQEADEALKETNGIRYNEFKANQGNYPYYIYIENRDPNMPEVAIVTDSTSDLTKEFIGDLSINIIPLKIKLNDNYYKDGVDISKREFWKRLLTENVAPKTSQPSPAEFKELYEKLFNKGYKKIISIHISSRLSGTQQAARVAKGMLNRADDITIVDSKAVTLVLGHQVLEAARMVQAGASYEKILERLDEMQEKMKLYFIVNDLSFLEKGGRIGRASSVIGGLLKVKPILKLENGEVTIEAKTFGDRGAFSYIEKLIKAESKKNSIILYTAWGGTNKELSKADAIKNMSDNFKKVEYKGRFEIGATIGSHSGPVFGFGMMSKIR